MNKLIIAVLLVMFSLAAYSEKASGTLLDHIQLNCHDCVEKLKNSTGVYILEHGEEALMSRAWLAENATSSIDVQYFIWSNDNIGILATEALLRAADRGVKVRVIVDDLLIDAEDNMLLSLESHPNVQIKVYNPKHSVGTSLPKRAFNAIRGFRSVNQRMHDKTAIFDKLVGITGGRNMADEYFDYDQKYNFRDRDILLIGNAVGSMTQNFNEFWNSELSVSVNKLLKNERKDLSNRETKKYIVGLHAYAKDEENFEPEVREALSHFPEYFPVLVKNLVWDQVNFISDVPGKNDNQILLSGGGEITDTLISQLKQAKKSVLIQSPYLVVPKGGIKLFKKLIKRGVSIQIITNSLASTDNLLAYSGYHKQRKKLLKAGVDIYEFMPHPKIQSDLVKRYPRLAYKNPVFAIHAKSMVIDSESVYIGTFNLDPRSANLNTEVGVLISNVVLAKQLEASIQQDMLPENSWRITRDFNPDNTVSFLKRAKLNTYKLLPLKQVL